MLTSTSLFQLKDLTYEYSSTGNFSSRQAVFKSMPNNETFDRNNRYEMLFLINSLQLLWNLEDILDCHKIEFMIKEKAPVEVERQLDITDWLVLNWNEFELPQFAKAV